MVIIIYVLSTIGYTLLFVETPMIIIPEHTFQIRFEDITYGFLILFLGFLMVGGALLYDFYQHILKRQFMYFLYAMYVYFFLIIQGVLLYGQDPIGNSWLSSDFYIDAFGLYDVYVQHQTFHFFFETIGMSIFHTILIGFAILILWRGKKNND